MDKDMTDHLLEWIMVIIVIPWMGFQTALYVLLLPIIAVAKLHVPNTTLKEFWWLNYI